MRVLPLWLALGPANLVRRVRTVNQIVSSLGKVQRPSQSAERCRWGCCMCLAQQSIVLAIWASLVGDAAAFDVGLV